MEMHQNLCWNSYVGFVDIMANNLVLSGEHWNGFHLVDLPVPNAFIIHILVLGLEASYTGTYTVQRTFLNRCSSERRVILNLTPKGTMTKSFKIVVCCENGYWSYSYSEFLKNSWASYYSVVCFQVILDIGKGDCGHVPLPDCWYQRAFPPTRVSGPSLCYAEF